MRSCIQWGLKAVLEAGSGEQSFGQKLLSTLESQIKARVSTQV